MTQLQQRRLRGGRDLDGVNEPGRTQAGGGAWPGRRPPPPPERPVHVCVTAEEFSSPQLRRADGDGRAAPVRAQRLRSDPTQVGQEDE